MGAINLQEWARVVKGTLWGLHSRVVIATIYLKR